MPAQSGIYLRQSGLILPKLTACPLHQRSERDAIKFPVPPKCRYRGEPLEHHTFYLQDPSGNWLDFKHYSQPEAVLGCTAIQEVGG